MIDFHCHILPELDDGAKSWEESLEMAQIAETDGISEIVCTPHVKEGFAVAPQRVIVERTLELQARIRGAGLRVRVHAGAEAAIEPSLVRQIRDGHISTLGGQARYLLLELAWDSIPLYTETVIFELLVNGVVPVIAHAERYKAVTADPDVVRSYVDRGALVQINSGSVTGFYGETVRSTAETLLTHGLVHLVGSDAHSAGHRSPRMADARRLIAGILGEESANRLTRENAATILSGGIVLRDEPIPIRRKRRVERRGFFSRVLGRRHEGQA